MARVSGLEKKDAPWHLRWFYGVMRKMFGKDFTPAKIQMRLPALVWGGIGMEAALDSRGCDLIGIARPAAVLPRLPKEIILNTKEIPDEEAQVTLAPLRVPWLIQHLPVKQVGAGFQSQYYASQIQRMARGLLPIDTRLTVSKSG